MNTIMYDNMTIAHTHTRTHLHAVTYAHAQTRVIIHTENIINSYRNGIQKRNIKVVDTSGIKWRLANC